MIQGRRGSRTILKPTSRPRSPRSTALSTELRTGASAVQLIPAHVGTTCSLYREIYIHEDGRVINVWPIVG